MLYTEEQRALRETARRFSRERLRPDYQKREQSERIDRELVREMGRLGLIGTDLPERYGGLGADGVTTGLIIEELAYGDFNVSYVQLMASLMGTLIVRNARPAVIERWLPLITSGAADRKSV